MKRFSNILFVANAHPGDSAALDRAVELANNNQAQLTITGIVDASEKEKSSDDIRTRHLLDASIALRRDELDGSLESAPPGWTTIEINVLAGDRFLEITREVLRNKRDLLIKLVDALAHGGRTLSSVDLKLIRKCPCPVWLIQPEQKPAYRNILVALAYDASSDPEVQALIAQLLQMASSIALADAAQLHIVHVFQLPHEGVLRSARMPYSDAEVDAMVEQERTLRHKWLESPVEEHCAEDSRETVDFLNPQLHLRQGNPSKAVPALANDLAVELIVMGTIGRTGIPRFLVENTAENIPQQVSSSILTVKPPGFECPVTVEDQR